MAPLPIERTIRYRPIWLGSVESWRVMRREGFF
jgi:hypothetical protein